MPTRRAKWHPPPPPTPRILHFPRRIRLFRPPKPRPISPAPPKPNLEALMRQESRRFRREHETAGDSAEARWKLQADFLPNRARMESAFTETMVSGRKKIDGRRPMAVDEEMIRKVEAIHGGNFDRRATVLRRRLETMEGETSVKEIREVADRIAEDKMALLASDRKCQFPDVEKLRMKMDGLSKGMIERMEEHGLLSLSFESAAAAAGDCRLHLRRAEEFGAVKQLESIGVGSCCNCKNLVDKIAEQVMAEAEQCSEMQGMLGKVKTDMEELRSSRDHWKHRALSSELNLRSLHSQMLEWKRRALESEKAAKHLRKAESLSPPTLSDQLDSEIFKLKHLKIREKQQKSSDLQAVKEKHVVVCQRRSTLQEIGNLPPKDSSARMFR